MIIMEVIPEGFVSTMLTCKRLYEHCIPYIEKYNALCSKFHHFKYYQNAGDWPFTIATAFDLITRIAEEPSYAYYIRSANFEWDCLSNYVVRWSKKLMKDIDRSEAIIKLFADSPYFEQAGLNWEMYFAEIVEDLRAGRYSQHAAVFLLTLLPNVKNVCLPKRWKTNDASDKLIDAVVRKAKHSHHPFERPSLSRVNRFGFSFSLGHPQRCELNWASPFLALPHIAAFRSRNCVAFNNGSNASTAFTSPHSIFSTTLETVHFEGCCIDEMSIVEFLKRCPSLKTLQYSHMSKENFNSQPWSICDFVTAIEREAGSHLEELSISSLSSSGPFVPVRISMSGFQRLRKLELPLDIIANFTDDDMNDNKPFIDDLIPTSVSELSLISDGRNDHANILEVIFRNFAVRKKQKKSTLSALKRIVLSCLDNASDAYKTQCDHVLAETKKAGIALRLMSGWRYETPAWEWGTIM